MVKDPTLKEPKGLSFYWRPAVHQRGTALLYLCGTRRTRGFRPRQNVLCGIPYRKTNWQNNYTSTSLSQQQFGTLLGAI
jgi:hypothetical protein